MSQDTHRNPPSSHGDPTTTVDLGPMQDGLMSLAMRTPFSLLMAQPLTLTQDKEALELAIGFHPFQGLPNGPN